MEYIEEVLGITVKRAKWENVSKLPYFLKNEYTFECVEVNRLNCLFITPNESLKTVNTLQKHIAAINKVCNYPVVVELEEITRQKRKSFIEANIPFIVNGKQIYLPFMGMMLTENFNSKRTYQVSEKLLPSAQMLLFLFIYGKCEPLYLNEAQKKLRLTAMSISRAARQLVELNLLTQKANGRKKILEYDLAPKALYEKAKEHLINPVRKTICINSAEITQDMFLAGNSALAELSFLNEPQVKTYGTATSVKEIEKSLDLIDIMNTDTDCMLEFWKYDATILSGRKNADILSLAVCFEDTADERTKIQIEKLLEKVWE